MLQVANYERVATFLAIDDDAAGGGTLTTVIWVESTREGPRTARQVGSFDSSQMDLIGLVGAMNEAARTGETAEVEVLVRDLPDDARHAVAESLGSAPVAAAMVKDDHGRPVLPIARKQATDPAALIEYATAAASLGQFTLLTNGSGESRLTEFGIDVYPVELSAANIDTSAARMPAPERGKVVQCRQEEDLEEAVSDARWWTHYSRLYGLTIPLGEGSSRWVWFAEYTDELLDRPAEHLLFPPGPADEEPHTVLTARNRFGLWMSLSCISDDLEALATGKAGKGLWLWRRLPSQVRHQPRDWWRDLARSAVRLIQAVHSGDVARMVPRTVGEEALLHLAVMDEGVQAAHERAVSLGLAGVFDTLPVHEFDDAWGEILPELTGDADVEMLWMDLAEVAGPEHVVNSLLGIGDLRPDAWHQLFDRAVERPLDPTET